MSDPLLAVEDLAVAYGDSRVVDGVSFSVDRGETLGIVGESGSGKTATVESLVRLLRSPGRVVGGDVRVDGRSTLDVDDAALRDLRGDVVGHAFQDPGAALNPVYSVGWQVAEAVSLHRDVGRGVARERAVELLDAVGIPDPEARAGDYPHELSGGMQQRVCLAMALAGDPALLVLDEPTTALDTTTQAAILSLLADLQAERGFGMVFVTHDLGVVASLADRVLVLYAGHAMERGPAEAVLNAPAHPYTRGLLASRPGARRSGATLSGDPPDPDDPPGGCRFHPRCPHAVPACREGDAPPAYDADTGQAVACVHYAPDGDPGVVREGER